MLVGVSPGGGIDRTARTLQKIMQDRHLAATPVNVVNKPGGSGAVAYSYLNQKKGDPYIIATATGSYITTPIQGHSLRARW